MSDRLAGKVAIITGGAAGIGEGAVRRFDEEGASVVISDLQVERGQALAEELGPSARCIRTDVTNEADVSAAVDFAVSEFGKLDCIINNAGIVGAVGSIKDTSAEDWDKTIAVHVRGAYLGSKHAARVMIPQRSGVIISVSSAAGILGGMGPHAYTTAKHAIIGLSKSVASELAQYGIRANVVAPSHVVSDMTAHVMTGNSGEHAEAEKGIASVTPLGFAGRPSDIANGMVYLASDEARFVTGHTLAIDSGVTTALADNRFHDLEPSLVQATAN